MRDYKVREVAVLTRTREEYMEWMESLPPSDLPVEVRDYRRNNGRIIVTRWSEDTQYNYHVFIMNQLSDTERMRGYIFEAVIVLSDYSDTQEIVDRAYSRLRNKIND